MFRTVDASDPWRLVGRSVEGAYTAGGAPHHAQGFGEYIIQDLENIGGTEFVFTTVEFVNSANAPHDLSAMPGTACAARCD